MSSALSFQWHLCDVFKVNLPDFLRHYYRLSPPLALCLHTASLAALRGQNEKAFSSLFCISLLLDA